MEHIVPIVAGVVLGLTYLLGSRYRNFRRRQAGPATAEADMTGIGEGGASERGTSDSGAAGVYAAAESLSAFFEQSAHPSDLVGNESFEAGVSLLGDLGQDDILAYAYGNNVTIACMAFEALSRKPGDEQAHERVLQRIGDIWGWPLFFALRFVRTREDRTLVARVLVRAADWWVDVPFVPEFLRSFIEDRRHSEDVAALGAELEGLSSERLATLDRLLDRLGSSLAGDFTRALSEWRHTHVDTEALRQVGRLWPVGGTDATIEHPAISANAQTVLDALKREGSRSVIVTGPSGVGKTELIRKVGAELQKAGWSIFEAGSTDLLAGTMYIGSLEERIRDLVGSLGPEKRIVWYIPAFHELLFAGRHQYSPQGALDRILPFIENGSVLVIGETRPESLDRLLEARPRLRSSLDLVRLEPLNEETTLELGRRWARMAAPDGSAVIDEDTLKEAHHLARQYLSRRAAPGDLLELLKITHARVTADGTVGGSIGLDDLLVSISQMTGLPVGILDDRTALPLEALRKLLNARVVGQPEAAECLIERVALIKAGLTDPDRPYGVFLFVGPTGTGKTEIAKALAEFLFGSATRMIRLDMSEFKTPAALDRILGSTDLAADESAAALVNQIRQQPFSVVLLDEFEKAHRQIWDLFLQVFDDGRLTDRSGNTVDFRHAIIILTSNLGAAIPRTLSMGFGESTGPDVPDRIMQEVSSTFSPEFLNRIDRTVIFRPLSRATMREILKKELQSALGRRGFRGREWAVEWDATAVDFLLEMGFTRDLGARPLRRAIERYLLSPLAMTIASHEYPEGDQFLFVRADRDALSVEFVDPDEPVGNDAAPARVQDASSGGILEVRSMALSPAGTQDEVRFLSERCDRLRETIAAPGWEDRKSSLLHRTGEPDFWQSESRSSVLTEIELMDRLEVGFDTALSLEDRLHRMANANRTRLPRGIIRRLAQQIYLVETACASLEAGLPHACFIRVAPGEAASDPEGDVLRFRHRLVSMYLEWGKKRRMTVRHLRESGPETDRADVIAVSGFGAFSILEPERGLHVLEIPVREKSTRRITVPVSVIPAGEAWPDTSAALLEEATRAFGEDDGTAARVVRRYRELPSPLVRDSVRGWRTGLFERVLEGDFDLIC
jgi:ATP-dependent Clp protease ATP-binding subunit ClpC